MSEIKISDLSVGDWVMYRNREWQVCSLYQFTGEVGLWRKDSQICENVADLTPIPLTPEILEKSGFVEMWGDFVVTHNGFYINIEVQENRFGLEVSADGHIIISCDVEFVHQLQHALRLACVGKEIEV